MFGTSVSDKSPPPTAVLDFLLFSSVYFFVLLDRRPANSSFITSFDSIESDEQLHVSRYLQISETQIRSNVTLYRHIQYVHDDVTVTNRIVTGISAYNGSHMVDGHDT